MFKALGQDEIDIVVNAMEEVKFQEGQTVITEGEPGNVLYVLEEGNLDCFKRINTEVSKRVYAVVDHVLSAKMITGFVFISLMSRLS